MSNVAGLALIAWGVAALLTFLWFATTPATDDGGEL